MKLETERMIIAPFETQDWHAFLELSQNPDVIAQVGPGQVWSDAKTQKWIAAQVRKQQEQGFSRYKTTLKETGELVGFCGADIFGNTGEAEIGWWVKQSLWGRGLASEAAAAVKRHLLNDLKLPGLISVCTPLNVPSMRIMQKIGLELRGRYTAEELGLPYKNLPVMVYQTKR